MCDVFLVINGEIIERKGRRQKRSSNFEGLRINKCRKEKIDEKTLLASEC